MSAPIRANLPAYEVHRGVQALEALSKIRVKGFTTCVGKSLAHCRRAMEPIREMLATAEQKYVRRDRDGEPIPQCSEPMKFDHYRGYWKRDETYLNGDIILKDSVFYQARDINSGQDPSENHEPWKIFGMAMALPYWTDFSSMVAEKTEIEESKIEVLLWPIPEHVWEDQLEKEEGYKPEMFWLPMVEGALEDGTVLAVDLSSADSTE